MFIVQPLLSPNSFHPQFVYTFWGYFLEPFFLHFFNTFFTLFGTLLVGKKMCEWLTDRGTDGRGAGRCLRCFTSKMCCFLLLDLLTSCFFFFCKIWLSDPLSFAQRFADYHTCSETVMIQHGQVYSNISWCCVKSLSFISRIDRILLITSHHTHTR